MYLFPEDLIVHKIIRPLALLLAVLLLFLPLCLPANAVSMRASPSVSAKSAILIEAESGRTIYEKNANSRLPMASTTKIMTALVALELADPQEIIAVARDAVGVEGSSIYLTEGETLTLEQLLYALLLESANDAAAAIAIGLSGSIEAFADEMNRMAESLGLCDTHFVNPHGLDHEEHYTTARELAIITQAALQHPLLSEIVATRKTTIPHAGSEGARLLVNHNKLLRMYEGCIGVKTGFTKHSGRCLVSAAERDGVTLIAVTLHAPDDWQDHTALFDYGFSCLQSVTLCEPHTLQYSLPVTGGTAEAVLLTNPQAHSVTLPTDAGDITYRIEGRRFEFAPISLGAPIATAVFYCDTDQDGTLEEIARVPLSASHTVDARKDTRGFWEWLTDLFS